MIKRVFYVSGGAADLIATHRYWGVGEDNATETSLTFSGQVADFIFKRGGNGFLVSANARTEILEDGRFVVEHLPKPRRSGLAWHIGEVVWCARLVKRARRFGADLALIDSGAIPFWTMRLFVLAGIPVIPILHNTIWPHGFRPCSGIKRMVSLLDSRFFRSGPVAAIAVSPEAARQIDEISPTRQPYPVKVALAQFRPTYFSGIAPPPNWSEAVFQMIFVGRITRSKGVFDILEIARICEARIPGRVRWTICGRGPDLDALLKRVERDKLGALVDIRGWTSVCDMQAVYNQAHAAIIPTRSSFEEGMAMTAVEAILAGRPIVTNPVVPAHEVLAPAAALGRTNDPASHAEAVIALASDPALYQKLRAACADLGAPFYDRRNGLEAVLLELIRV